MDHGRRRVRQGTWARTQQGRIIPQLKYAKPLSLVFLFPAHFPGLMTAAGYRYISSAENHITHEA